MAWLDLYAAAPATWAREVGLAGHERSGAVLLEWAATGRRYFSRAIGLGVTAPATEAAIDGILRHYEEAEVGMFLLQSLPHCRPAKYEGWLRDRGLEPFDAQDRIVRDGSPIALSEPLPPGSASSTVERVTEVPPRTSGPTSFRRFTGWIRGPGCRG